MTESLVNTQNNFPVSKLDAKTYLLLYKAIWIIIIVHGFY
jgi:hypothetical protein